MALIGINPVSNNNPNSEGVFGRVLKGLTVANSILGTGINAYKAFGPEATAAEAQANLANAQAGLAGAQTQQIPVTGAIEAYKAGGIPVPGAYSISGMPQHGTLAKNSAKNHEQLLSSLQGDATQNGALPVSPDLVPQNNPQLVKIGDQHFYFPAVNRPVTENEKFAAELASKSGKQLTLTTDPEKNGAITIPGTNPFTGLPSEDPKYTLHFAVKDTPETKNKNLDASQKLAKDYQDNEIVKNFGDLSIAASTALALANKPVITNPDAIALLQNQIKVFAPKVRFNNDNIEGIEPQDESKISVYKNMLKKLYTDKNSVLDRGTVNNIIDSIQTQYTAAKQFYDPVYNEYAANAKAQGFNPVSPLPGLPVKSFQRIQGASNNVQGAMSSPMKNNSKASTLKFLGAE